MKEKKLFLIDAMALIYRSFYAMNKSPRVNSKGMNTSAAFGFFTTLLSILKQYNPSHLGIALDLHSPTFRHEKYPDYKANRPSTPEEIRQMEPYIYSIIEAMNIPMLSCEGFEADDVIGTLAKKAVKHGFDVYMVTPDKDYAQLVEEHIKMLKLGRMGNQAEIWGVDEVLERFEVQNPRQVIDILGLWGDSSDNIPGVAGIGEKKAKALLKQFSSIEDAIANSDKIEAKSLRKALEDNKEQALESKFLATIVLDVPIEFDPERLQISKPDMQRCAELFGELEFKSFAQKFFEYFSSADNLPAFSASTAQPLFQTALFSESSQRQSIDSQAHSYMEIKQNEELKQIVEQLKTKELISFYYYEQEGVPMGISFCCDAHKAWFIRLDTSPKEREETMSLIKELFESQSVEKITYDLKSQKHFLDLYGCEVSGKCYDVMLAHYLIDSEAVHRLDFVSESMLDYTMLDASSLFAKKKASDLLSVSDIEREKRDFVCERADVIFRLRDITYAKLREDKLDKLFDEVEMPLVNVLFAMEKRGVKINSDTLEQFSAKLGERKSELESQIYDLAGEKFNISSPRQLGEVLFTRLQIVGDAKAKRTATRQFSTAEEVLQKLVNAHPIVPLIMEYRTLSKLKSTYADSLPALVNPHTKRVHTSYNQSVTATGRLSSNNPNLQNIPIKTDWGKEIRKCFVPADENHVLLAADYSQIELRIIASLSEDEHLCNAFKAGEDIHLATAAKIYSLPKEQITKQQRANVKSVNFGIIYGISAFGLSQQLNITRKEAQKLIDQYFENYPRVKEYIQWCKQTAREKGYAESMCGRRRYLKDINSGNVNLRSFAERNAVNMPVQASSADMIKIAMVRIFERMEKEKLQSSMIMQVHDELVFDVLKPELDKMKAIVVEEMTNALLLKVPVVVEAQSGENWLEAH